MQGEDTDTASPDQDLEREEREEQQIRELVNAAPPLTGELAARLRRMITGSGG